MTTFAELGLAPDILEGIEGVGYETPSPIQERAIPPLLQGRDVIGKLRRARARRPPSACP